jgi:CheY-like chemotaxis protein
MMPKMDGIEATKIMRDMGYTHNIVALTANALIGRAEMFLQNGFDGFISKPIDSRELNIVLNEFIRNRKPPEVVEAARRERKLAQLSPISVSDELAMVAAQDIKNALAVIEDILPKISVPGETSLPLFTTTVHGIKSALANIGKAKLSSIALRLEQAGNSGDTSVILTETPIFIDLLRSLAEEFKSDETGSETELSHDDINLLQARLADIEKACEHFDVKTAKASLAELRQKGWPRVISETLEGISVCLLRGEFKKVASAVEKLRKAE